MMKIDYRFKIMYAIGMIFIVAGHCENGGISLLYEWFPPYSFHLGLFAFISGYFYRDSANRNPKKYIIQKAKRLIVPLYLWNIFYFVLILCLSSVDFSIGWQKLNYGLWNWGIALVSLLIVPLVSGYQYSMGGWFIVPLFMVQIYNLFFRRILGLIMNPINEWIAFFINLFLGFGGVYLASKGFNTGLWLPLVRMLYFIPFYSAGVLYRKKLECYDTIKCSKYFTVLFLVQLIVISVIGRIPTYTPSWCNDFINGPILPFVVGFTGIAFWLRVSTLLEPVIGRSAWINYIADNTYSIMINQFMGFMVIKTFFALLSKYTKFCGNFDWVRYKSDIWYYYLPKDIPQMRILYLVAGIVVPIIMQLFVDRLKNQKLKK